MKKLSKANWKIMILNIGIFCMLILLTIEAAVQIADHNEAYKDGWEADRFYDQFENDNYARALELYYENVTSDYQADEDTQECYGVVRYYEASYLYHVALQNKDMTKASEEKAHMEEAVSSMGSLSSFKEKIDSFFIEKEINESNET